jgi:hypothetical protein
MSNGRVRRRRREARGRDLRCPDRRLALRRHSRYRFRFRHTSCLNQLTPCHSRRRCRSGCQSHPSCLKQLMRPRGGAPVRSGSGTDLSRPDRLGRPGQSTIACLGMGRACHPEQCSDETDYSDAEQTHDLALELRRPRRQFAAVRRVTASPLGQPSSPTSSHRSRTLQRGRSVYMSKDKGLQGGSREFPRHPGDPDCSGHRSALRRKRGSSGGQRRTAQAKVATPAPPASGFCTLDPENMHVHHLVLLLASLHRMEKRGSIP